VAESAFPINSFGARAAALQSAGRRILGRPGASALAIGALACALAGAALVAIAAWRSAPFEAPSWMQAEALVLATGAEGEVDLAALRGALRAALPQPAAAVGFEFVGRDTALRDLAQRRGLAGTGLADLRPNPLPDGFRVRFAPGTPPEQIDAAVGALRRVRGVDAVEFDAQLVRRAALLVALCGRVAMLAGVLLAATLLLAAFVAATVWSRAADDELFVLHLLGAEPAAMVRPAAYAAGLGVLCAALLAWGFVVVLAGAMDPLAAEFARQYGLHWEPLALPPWTPVPLCLALAGAGALAASLGLRATLRRRLARLAGALRR